MGSVECWWGGRMETGASEGRIWPFPSFFSRPVVWFAAARFAAGLRMGAGLGNLPHAPEGP